MKSRASSAALLLAALWGLGLVEPASAQMVQIPGTSVAMTPPPGFKLSRTGLEDPDSGSSVSVAEMPADGFAKLAATFASPKTASAGFAGQGIKITRIEQIAVEGGQIPLAIGDQSQSGQQLTKYIAVMGGPMLHTNAVLITFNLTSTSRVRQGDVEAALKSVRLARVPTTEEKVAGLPFKFNAVAPFHTADVFSNGTALLTTYQGSDPAGAKPALMISRGSTQDGPDDMPKTNERMLRAMGGFADAEITEQKPVPFAGGDGHFMSAVAGGKTMLQFILVRSNGTFVRLVARGDTSAMEEARAVVAEIADSVAFSN
ncbi:MAG TPA: hypothetical protein VE907_11600 [Gammaproteobacteria bacterium]|nr:hypothetical protein [Gammaproteobacteria bacterium]